MQQRGADVADAVAPMADAGRERRARTRSVAAAKTAIHVALEALLLALAFGAAHWARYVAQLGGAVDAENLTPLSVYTGYAALLFVAILALFGARGLYSLPRGTSYLTEATRAVEAITVAHGAVLVVVFLSPELVSSRLFVIYAWASIVAAVVIERGLKRMMRSWLWQRGIGVERALVVGSGESAARVVSDLAGRNILGFRLIGFVDDGATRDEDWLVGSRHGIVRPPHLGGSDDLARVLAERAISEVVIALPPEAHERILRVIAACRAADVRFQIVPDVFALSLGQVQVNTLNGLPLLTVRDGRIRGWNRTVKRGVDILGALAAFAVLGVPMLLLALVIRLDSRGPALIRQTRVGKDGAKFLCFKFRSMHAGADKQHAAVTAGCKTDRRLQKVKDDPRRTRVGKFIRRTSLDELPQLLNVLGGQMSLVGPRPQVPREVAHYEPWHRQRLAVPPGMTGIWQITGRSDLTFDEMVRLDVYYAEHWSVRLDLEILLRTLPAVLSQRGAY